MLRTVKRKSSSSSSTVLFSKACPMPLPSPDITSEVGSPSAVHTAYCLSIGSSRNSSPRAMSALTR
eukprot:16450373-Heterocapsa_arctica.AAC.1